MYLMVIPLVQIRHPVRNLSDLQAARILFRSEAPTYLNPL